MSLSVMAIPTTRPAGIAEHAEIPLESEPDALTIGRRIRHLRTARGMTLDELGAAIGRAPSQVSLLENGKREPKFGQLQAVARALGASLDDLLSPEAPSRRDALEIELERAQRGPLFDALGLRPVRVGKSLPTDALETIVALERELQRLHTERAATPEEARRANAELRATMRAQDNYFPELEDAAAGLLDGVGHAGGPMPQRVAADLAAHLGFTLHYVGDLPHSTRSVLDLRHRRVYLPSNGMRGRSNATSALLQALAPHVLGHAEPRDYREFLRQRVEANYLAAALLLPERHAVKALRAAKDAREISIEDLRDAFAVSYETAAHRFTNLATKHLGIPVHFMKVHESGVIHKAYENDGVRFPADPLGAVEGQYVCRLDRAHRVRRRGPAQPVQPVHGHPERHLLVHVARAGVGRRRVLRERRRPVRARQVVPRARHDRAARVPLPRRRVLPPPARRPRRPLGRPRLAERPPARVDARGDADRRVPRRRPDRGLLVPRGPRAGLAGPCLRALRPVRAVRASRVGGRRSAVSRSSRPRRERPSRP